MKRLTGSCLCKKIKLQIPDRFDHVGNCHCSECRKFSGSAFAVAGVIGLDDLSIMEGDEHITYYQKSESSIVGFCKHCGSSLFTKKLAAGKYAIRLGILDDVPTQKPAFHIFVGSKADWFDITDDLPQFDEYPPAN